ncbi:hypothetical protein ACJX0J_032444, partial [Zea mays]
DVMGTVLRKVLGGIINCLFLAETEIVCTAILTIKSFQVVAVLSSPISFHTCYVSKSWLQRELIYLVFTLTHVAIGHWPKGNPGRSYGEMNGFFAVEKIAKV